MTHLAWAAIPFVFLALLLVGFAGFSNVVIEQFRKERARHAAEIAARQKKERADIISAFIDMIREAAAKKNARAK